jgi:hypothetical protein
MQRGGLQIGRTGVRDVSVVSPNNRLKLTARDPSAGEMTRRWSRAAA